LVGLADNESDLQGNIEAEMTRRGERKRARKGTEGGVAFLGPFARTRCNK